MTFINWALLKLKLTNNLSTCFSFGNWYAFCVRLAFQTLYSCLLPWCRMKFSVIFFPKYLVHNFLFIFWIMLFIAEKWSRRSAQRIRSKTLHIYFSTSNTESINHFSASKQNETMLRIYWKNKYGEWKMTMTNNNSQQNAWNCAVWIGYIAYLFCVELRVSKMLHSTGGVQSAGACCMKMK